MRPGEDMGADQFSNFCGCLRAGIDRSFHAADVAPAQDGDQPAADGDGFDEVDVCGFDHCVTGFHAADITLGFDHS